MAYVVFMNTGEEFIKNRDICFTSLPPDQAHNAMLLLSDVYGVESMHLAKKDCLHMGYDIRVLTLKSIERALKDVGFHLAGGLLYRLKRALYAYTEEAQREKLGISDQSSEHNDMRESLHRKVISNHHAEDPRPNDWRKFT